MKSAALAVLFAAGVGAVVGCSGPKTGPGLEPPLPIMGGPTGNGSPPVTGGPLTPVPSAGNNSAPDGAQTGSAGRASTTPPPAMPEAQAGNGSSGFGNGSAGSSSGPSMGEDPTVGCIAATQPVSPLALQFVVDESLSMVFPRDLWSPLTGALDAFVAGQTAAPLAIGVQFFQGECDAAAYAVQEVPIAPAGELPGLAERMDGRTHGVGAATALALTAATAEAEVWSSAHAQRAALVLISASAPSACGADAEGAASAGLAQSLPVPTYVIALRELASLDRIAQAGGTGAAVRVAEPASEQALAQALAAVAERAACEFALPPEAGPYVPDQVNVRLTREGVSSLLPRVADQAGCDPARGGFYYDDAQTRIRTCPASCQQLQAGGSVELLFGCASVSL